ncbi:hypothetical protein BpHYR1_004935 [Brachionus plicatilis]|uniref:Uncharacterized protein n=1 Tax=Brachionus plicatilis TaxID=10195 RepID=A0A3M7S0Y5_BRAPC|nr:hypothetical protein BpHYR1_004935 [Brachionus plicatilis]
MIRFFLKYFLNLLGIKTQISDLTWDRWYVALRTKPKFLVSLQGITKRIKIDYRKNTRSLKDFK